MKLNNYTNFSDKANSGLSLNKVLNLTDINDIFIQFNYFKTKKGEDRLIFRGVNEASYKMYTSSQRDWINNRFELEYSSYLIEILEKSKNWNNSILKHYFELLSDNVDEKNLSYFSIMQHYGLPTPLLDFTYNPFVALYFACKNVENCYYDNDTDCIRNYFSVYFIWPKWLDKKDFTKKLTDINLSELKSEVYQIENDKTVNNNLNIIAQEGLFLVNTFSDEDLFTAMQTTSRHNDKIRFGCYNIHKSFAKSIKERLCSEGYTDFNLFPDINKMNE